MGEARDEEVLEFKWGKKRGIGGKKKDVQFYESFTYDGVDYALYDSVFLHKDGEPEPYVGKLIKIWQNGDKSKKVKVLWYFRPCEILNYLEGSETLDNELFLASGEGVGLANINPLEAIAGKCNVLCVSKDNRNQHPSNEQLQMADFVFYRFFDVGKCKILDKIDDMIAGVEVKNIFNNLDSQKLVGLMKHGLDVKEVSEKTMTHIEADGLSSQEINKSSIETLDSKCFDGLVKENADYESLLEKKPTSKVGLREASKSNSTLRFASNNIAMCKDEVKENGLHKSLLKPKSSNKVLDGSRIDMEKKDIVKTNDRRGNVLDDKNVLRSRLDSERGEPVGQIDNVLVEDKGFMKESQGGSIKVSSVKTNNSHSRRLITCDDDDGGGDSDVNIKDPSSSKDKYKLQRLKDSREAVEVPSKKLKIDKKSSKLSSDNLRKESSTVLPNVDHMSGSRAVEVTRRSDVDRSKWFKGFPWEERLKTAYEQGKLVLLQNLDPSLTSSEVQDIIWHGFKENCTAKVIQKTSYSSPHSGQAFVIFKGKEAAESVVRKLDEGCFLMSNGRPLVGNHGVPCFSDKKPKFLGHHVVDQLRMIQMQREMKDAVSTSHCSQPNNIEYDMAIEWCLLQEREKICWRKLFQRQGEELNKLKAKLKSTFD